jgi:hypothetical protein
MAKNNRPNLPRHSFDLAPALVPPKVPGKWSVSGYFRYCPHHVRIADCWAILRTTASSPQIVFTTFLQFSYMIIFNFDPQIAQGRIEAEKRTPD